MSQQYISIFLGYDFLFLPHRFDSSRYRICFEHEEIPWCWHRWCPWAIWAYRYL